MKRPDIPQPTHLDDPDQASAEDLHGVWEEEPPEAISPKTNERYEGNMESFKQQARQTLGLAVEDTLTPDQLVDWFMTMKYREISASSWRVYRASMIWCLDRSGTPEGVSAAARLRGFKPTEAPGKGKAATMSADDLRKLQEGLLANSGGKYNLLLHYYFDASIAVGLRLSEWSHAELMDQPPRTPSASEKSLMFFQAGPWLKVCAAKDVQNSASRKSRHLNLLAMPAPTIDIVRNLIDKICYITTKADWRDVERSMAMALQRVRQQVWADDPPRYTLGTPRMVFESRASARLGPIPAAALMGEISDKNISRRTCVSLDPEFRDMPLPIGDPLDVQALIERASVEKRTRAW